MNKGAVAVGVVALLGLGMLFGSGDDDGGGGSDDGPDDVGAQVVCQEFVERRLKAPSTADFSDESVTNGGGTWTVRGSVDAENSFGAKIRNTYVCEVKPSDSSGDNWTLVNISLQ